jgi:ATP:corrinoid adenosyltransferase
MLPWLRKGSKHQEKPCAVAGYDMVILDEINCAIGLNIIYLNDVLLK